MALTQAALRAGARLKGWADKLPESLSSTNLAGLQTLSRDAAIA